LIRTWFSSGLCHIPFDDVLTDLEIEKGRVERSESMEPNGMDLENQRANNTIKIEWLGRESIWKNRRERFDLHLAEILIDQCPQPCSFSLFPLSKS